MERDETAQEAQEEIDRRDSLLEQFNHTVGKRYSTCSLESFEDCGDVHKQAVLRGITEYASNLPEEVTAGRGVILFGPVGTGKDHLLVALARIAIEQYGIDVMWRDCLDVFSEIRDRINEQLDEAPFIRRLINPTVLYLSDPEQLTVHQSRALKQIIDRRYRDLKPTWVALNAANVSEASESVGVAAVDRLRHNALALHCNWPSYRQARKPNE